MDSSKLPSSPCPSGTATSFPENEDGDLLYMTEPISFSNSQAPLETNILERIKKLKPSGPININPTWSYLLLATGGSILFFRTAQRAYRKRMAKLTALAPNSSTTLVSPTKMDTNPSNFPWFSRNSSILNSNTNIEGYPSMISPSHIPLKEFSSDLHKDFIPYNVSEIKNSKSELPNKKQTHIFFSTPQNKGLGTTVCSSDQNESHQHTGQREHTAQMDPTSSQEHSQMDLPIDDPYSDNLDTKELEFRKKLKNIKISSVFTPFELLKLFGIPTLFNLAFVVIFWLIFKWSFQISDVSHFVKTMKWLFRTGPPPKNDHLP